MKFMAGKVAMSVVALGVTLGGCASIDSVEDALTRADTADRHAGAAQSRADEAYGIGSDARAIGNNALSSAQRANEKADATAGDLSRLERRVGILEDKARPHPKKKVRRHKTPAPAATDQPKPTNS